MTKIAMLGLGAMGARMAARLLDSSEGASAPTLAVYNRTAARAAPLAALGAEVAATPRAAVERADLVFSMLTDDEASRAAWLDPEAGALAGLRPGALAVECSTVTPTWVETLAAATRKRDARFVEAPVVGSRPQAETGALVFLVGGEAEDVETLRAWAERLGRALHHVGPAGTAAHMKLAVNGFFAAQVATLAELLGGLARAEVAPEAAMTVFAELPITSPALRGLGGAMVADQHDPLFPVELVAKDLRYATATAEDLGAPTPMLTAARVAYEAATADGLGGLNIAGIARRYLDGD